MRLLSVPIVISRALTMFGSYVVLPVLACLITADVIMRYVFNNPIWWSLEASKYLLLLFFMCGLADSLRQGVHIRMALLYDRMSVGTKRIVSLMTAAGLVFAFTFLVIAAYDQAVFRLRLGTLTNDLQMPLWAWYGAIAAIGAVVILQVVALSIEVVAGRREMLDDNSHILEED